MSLADDVKLLTEKVAELEKKVIAKVDDYNNSFQLTTPLRKMPTIKDIRDGEIRVVRENVNAKPYLIYRSADSIVPVFTGTLPIPDYGNVQRVYSEEFSSTEYTEIYKTVEDCWLNIYAYRPGTANTATLKINNLEVSLRVNAGAGNYLVFVPANTSIYMKVDGYTFNVRIDKIGI